MAGIVSEFAVGNDGQVAAIRKKLHDFGACAGELRPAGSGFGILFETTVRVAVEVKIDLREAAFSGAPDGIGLASDGDLLCVVDEGLLPDREKDFVERGCRLVRRHGAMIAGIRETGLQKVVAEIEAEKEGHDLSCPYRLGFRPAVWICASRLGVRTCASALLRKARRYLLRSVLVVPRPVQKS